MTGSDIGEVVFDLFASGQKPDPGCSTCSGAGIVRVGHHVWQRCPECSDEKEVTPADTTSTTGDEGRGS